VSEHELSDAIQRGERRALARGITLVESSKAEHQDRAQALLDEVVPRTGTAHRVGISGTPGVGKSTFIESFGLFLLERGHKVAVLAVDPSSPKTGGSVLGDKTRMELLSREPKAFIRPSPSGGQLGGVARRTREAMLLCEAAGYDVVLVETVGTGQSEAAVAEMVDTFVLLMAPGGGDELQGVKRGVLELCDVVLVNKNDGGLVDAARRTAQEYRSGLAVTRGANQVPVVLVSAREKTGLDDAWQTVREHRTGLESTGALDDKRADQAEAFLWHAARDELVSRFQDEMNHELDAAVADVRAAKRSPTRAARALVERFLSREDA
jgi:LAO/AO transport system kinase